MKALSAKQLEQRREAGRALAAKVERDYYRFIGRRGGRRFMFNQLIRLANEYSCPMCALGVCKITNPLRHEAWVNKFRADYQAEAYERYFDYTGNRMMLALFARSEQGFSNYE
jgi:hypothetical protein